MSPARTGSTDADDALLVEVLHRLFADVGDFARDLLDAAVGVADLKLELLDVDRGEDVVLGEPLAQQDGVLIVVAAPGHEGHQHVGAQGQLALGGGGAVGERVSGLHPIPLAHQRALVDAGVLVGALELGDVVDVDAGSVAEVDDLPLGLAAVELDHDAVGRHLLHHASALGGDDGPRIAGHLPLEAGAHHRRLGAQERHRLTLHVGTHERAVGVVVLEERDQRGRRAHDLHGREVHEIDVLGVGDRELAAVTHHEPRGLELAVGADRLVGLGDARAILDVGGDELHLGSGGDAVLHPAIGRLQEPEVVHARVRGQTRDETDVRTFRGLDRAHAAVVGVVHVADLEARAVAGEAARSEGGEASLVGQLGQRIRLIHELAQLARPEERLDHRADGAGVHEVVRGDVLRVLQAHPLANDARHAGETDVELIGEELAHRTHPAVAEMVDVVRGHVGMVHPQHEQVLDDGHEVLGGQRGEVVRGRGQGEPSHAVGAAHQLDVVELLVQLEATDLGQVVALGTEEEPAQDFTRGLAARRLARTQKLVDARQRVILAGRRVALERVAGDVGVLLHGDDVDLEFLDPVLGQFLDLLDAQLVVGLDQDLAGLGIHDIFGHHPAFQGVVLLATAAADIERLDRVEEIEDGLFGGVAQSLEQHGDRQLPLAVDVHVHDVVHVERELHPRAAVRDDARREQPLAVGVNAVVEEHARRAMELTHDHALGAVDDEGSLVGQERKLPEVHLLLDDLLVPLLPFHVLADAQAQGGLQRRGEGEVSLLALVDRVLGLAEAVGDEFQGEEIAGIGDGEDGGEDLLEPHHLALFGRRPELEEVLERSQLDVEEVGKFHQPGLVQLAEAASLNVVQPVVQGRCPCSR